MPFPQTAQFAICFAPPRIFLSLYYEQAHNMIYSIRKKKILQVKIKKNIKNVIYDYEFWKKAVIIDTKLALLCVREKTGQPVAFLQI